MVARDACGWRSMDHRGEKSDEAGQRWATMKGNAGDHKGPPRTTLPPSPLRKLEFVS